METFLKKDSKDLKRSLILSAFLDCYYTIQKDNRFAKNCIKFYNDAKVGGMDSKLLHDALNMPTEKIFMTIDNDEISMEDAGKLLLTISLLRDGFILSKEEERVEKIFVALRQHNFLIEALEVTLKSF